MKPVLFYDAETTGFPLFKERSIHPDQPHIVQLAAALVDPDARKTLASMDVIVRPESWTIPDDATAIHGITTEMACDLGVSESLAVEMLIQMWRRSGLRVGHNEAFDARIVRIAMMRFGPLWGYSSAEAEADEWKQAPAECTARLATPICNLPPSDKQVARTNFKRKTPDLSEAYRHFMGSELRNAHSAMDDVMACQYVYFSIKDMEVCA